MWEYYVNVLTSEFNRMSCFYSDLNSHLLVAFEQFQIWVQYFLRWSEKYSIKNKKMIGKKNVYFK